MPETITTNELIQSLKPYCVFAYILGSFNTPRFQKESDIDLAVYWILDYDIKIKSSIKNNLTQLAQRDVEIAELNHIDPIFAYQVLKTGRLLFCQNDLIHIKWKIKYISMYIDFKMDRKNIENNLLHRKRYF